MSRLRVALLISVALATPARGGAWLAPEGHGVVVVTDTQSEAGRIFDASGAAQPSAHTSKTELQVLMEYGVTDWLTAIAIPSLQHIDIGPPDNGDRTGFGNSEFGARARVMQQDNWVLSAQGTLRVPGTFDANNPAAVGYTGIDVDLRGLFGVGFAIAGMPSFFDVQLAQRFRTGGPPSEARLDVTLGVRTTEKWLLLMQQFNVFSEGAGRDPFPANNYHKLQMSVVYSITPQWAFQGGGFTTFAGRNALQENGLIAGVWYRF